MKERKKEAKKEIYKTYFIFISSIVYLFVVVYTS